jgi:exoribonuclease R
MPRRHVHLVSDGAVLRQGFDRLRDELHVPGAFDADVLAEAEEAARTPRSSGPAREDLTDLPFVTLDPPGSTDLDQAMHLSRSGTGYLVRYAIADVASFVRPGGALDAETHRRVETHYWPDRRSPRHPAVLSEDAASLLEGQVRPAFCWQIHLDADGAVAASDVRRAGVRSVAQLDYPGVQLALDRGDAAEPYVLLREVGERRRAVADARGAVSVTLPEQEVVPAGDGWTLSYRTPLACEEWNAQISLLTGVVAAEIMLEGGIGVLRTMPAADARDLARLRRTAHALGIEWGVQESYGDVVRTLDPAKPRVAAFLQEAMVLFRGAAWVGFDGEVPEQTEHAAVAAPYAHVTAPLRRLVDRFGLETCVSLAAGADVPEWVRAALPTIGQEMAEGVRRGNALERGVTDLVEAAVLASHVGETFDAVVVDRREKDLVVQLSDPAVVGSCHPAAVELGARVSVRLVEASVAERRIFFEVA